MFAEFSLIHVTWDKLHQIIRLDAEHQLPESRRVKGHSVLILGLQLVLTVGRVLTLNCECLRWWDYGVFWPRNGAFESSHASSSGWTREQASKKHFSLLQVFFCLFSWFSNVRESPALSEPLWMWLAIRVGGFLKLTLRGLLFFLLLLFRTVCCHCEATLRVCSFPLKSQNKECMESSPLS